MLVVEVTNFTKRGRLKTAPAHTAVPTAVARAGQRALRDDATGSARRCWGEGSRLEALDRPDEFDVRPVVCGVGPAIELGFPHQ